MRANVILATGLIFALGCGGGKDDASSGGSAGGSSSPPAAAASPARDALLDAWKKAGLPASGFVDTKGFGPTCWSGPVNGIDVMVCEHPKSADAKAGEKAGYDWVGDSTGAAWSSGTLVIAVADRKKADPSGKTINQLMKLTPKHPD